MRTRSQSKGLQNTGEQQGKRTRNGRASESTDDNETLSEISRGAVGKLLKRVKRGFDREDVGYLRRLETEPEIGSNGKDKNSRGTTWDNDSTDPVIWRGDAITDASFKAEANVGVSQLSIPEKNEDHNDLVWEDGSIPTLSTSNNYQEDSINEVSVEFDISPDSAMRKPVRRATVEEKEVAELVHKAHLLCLLGRGRLIDAACNDPLIQASLLSLLPTHLLKLADDPKLTASRLSPLVSWFHKNFCVRIPSMAEKCCHLALASTLGTREGTPEMVAALSVVLFRALNLTCRFVSVLDVVSFKPDTDNSESILKLISKGETNIFNSSTLMASGKSCSFMKSSSDFMQNNTLTAIRDAHKQKAGRSMKHGSQTQDSIITDISESKSSHKEVSETLSDTSQSCLNKSDGLMMKGDLEFQMQMEMALSSTAVGSSKNSVLPSVVELPSASSILTPPSTRMKNIRMEECSSGGVSIAIGSQKVGAPLCWAEVFCGGENLTGKWVHVDAVNAIIDGEHKVEDAAAACKKSLRYVVAFAGSGAKDVTRRYCRKWYKVASQRVNSSWWDAVLGPLKELESGATNCVGHRASGDMKTEESFEECGKNMRNSFVSTRSSLEDMELETRALTEPLPTNQQAYNNHHLYVIERWLKKYEVLYPKGPILGFCSGHAVYPRTCVQVIHTKERWLREGLQVKAGELPVKILNRSLKRGKEAEEDDDCADGDIGRSTDLYGKWQTEPLHLPRAVNGIVPRNERGQVDVWSEKCLPPGTVYLPLPRVAPIARRLEVDFAPAMVGFDFRNGRSVPVFEGIVVCAEFKDAILKAYGEEEAKRVADEKRKNEAQALSRWYQLLSSIITRQRLNDCYNGDASSSQPYVAISRSDDNRSKSDVVPKKVLVEKSPTLQEMNIAKKQADTSYSSCIPSENHEHEFVLDKRASDKEGSARVKRCHCGFSIQFEEL